MKSPTQQTSSRRGRPRSLKSKKSIMEAAVELCNEVGFQCMSIEGIADRAGVGKQTIYRWWPNLASLLSESLIELADKSIASNRDAERWADHTKMYLLRLFKTGRKNKGILSKIIAFAQLDDLAREKLTKELMPPRRDLARHILFKNRHPVRRELLLGILFAVFFYGVLNDENTLSNEMIDFLDKLMSGRT